MAAVSTISTMKVERPRARSSAAPTRENRRSTIPICADSAGTKLPICARMAISAFCRRNVDLPAMLGPVTSHIRPASPPRKVAIVRHEGAGVFCSQAPLRPPDGARARCERRGCHPLWAARSAARPPVRQVRPPRRCAPELWQRWRERSRGIERVRAQLFEQFALDGERLVARFGKCAPLACRVHRSRSERRCRWFGDGGTARGCRPSAACRRVAASPR